MNSKSIDYIYIRSTVSIQLQDKDHIQGAQEGAEPPVKITVHFGGPSPNSCIGLVFQSALTLLLQCFVLL